MAVECASVTRAVGRALPVFMAVLGLSACSLLGGGTKPLDTYELTAPGPDSTSAHGHRRQVLLAEPSAIKALDGQNIVIKPAPGIINYLGGAQWADSLPKLVQAKLLEAFQRTGRITGVGRPGEGLAIDYQVIIDVRSFEIRLDPSARAYVELSVRLLNDRNGVVRRLRVFDATVPVSGKDNDDYIRGLDTAFREVAAGIVAWTLASI